MDVNHRGGSSAQPVSDLLTCYPELGGEAGCVAPAVSGVNKLYFGDNLEWLHKMDPNTVDLVYLDPPFNSKAAYNLLYRSPDGEAAESQYQAFVDSWRWGPSTDAAMAAVIASGSPAAGILTSLNNYMQKSDIMAYLTMMAARLIELHRVLKNTGSLYLHCDSSASHYLKIILDAVFGAEAFRNEIVWRRTGSHNSARRFGPIHDTLLFYTKTKQYTWNPLKRPYMVGHVEKAFVNDEGVYRTNYSGNVLSGSGRRGGESGKPWRGFDPDAKGRHWAIPRTILEELDEDISHLGTLDKLEYLYEHGLITISKGDEWPRYQRTITGADGQPLSDIWAFQPYTEGTVFGFPDEGIDEDVRWMGTKDGERLGYQTQKPLGLLKRIIRASSKEGDLILDPFCGCGTTIEAAQALNRNWIGIDITVLAIDVVERRLNRMGLRRNADYKVDGIPPDLAGARRLFAENPHQFQLWALTLVDGQPREGGKKGADKGVDGFIYFQDDAKTIGTAIISVKGGVNIHAEHVRDLLGAMTTQRAKLGVFVTLNEPTGAMEKAAREAESIEAGGKLIPRIQICTIDALLKGRKPKLPPVYDIISAAAAFRRGRGKTYEPTPDEIRQSPSFKLPISGGKKSDQKSLPMDEPLLVREPTTPVGRPRRRRRSA
jgi:DNA modification methylase